MPGQRILIASNRLPMTFDPASGKITPSSGGLVTAIRGVRWEGDVVWVGTIPASVAAEAGEAFEKVHDGFQFTPVPVSEEDYAAYYGGFSNGALWPLLHYESDRVDFQWPQWKAYREVNRAFAEKIAEIAAPDDLVWIHDYQLFLVPHFLREMAPRLRIGFFLHVPFPSSEMFRQLPVREEILSSLLDADLVGFHDYSYLRHFCTSIQLLLGVESNMLTVEHRDRVGRLGVFPVSIDSRQIRECAESEGVKARAKEYEEKRPCPHTILGVDRLDYTKALDLKLLAFREMLQQFPELVGKVALMQIAVPTRGEVPEYQRLKATVEQLVGEINGQFGAPHYVPVQYIHDTVDFDELIALYRAAELLLVTSKRDGMNLVALEYLLAQKPEKPGVVLLSEFTGAWSTLSGVIPINPWDTAKTGRAMGQAILNPNPDRVERHAMMLKYLNRYDATAWASAFLKQLSYASDLAEARKTSVLDPENPPSPVVEILKSERCVLFLDYDGTLTGIRDRIEDATLGPETRKLLVALAATRGTEVVIVSGRSRAFLEAQFRDVDVTLAAEHGAIFRVNRDWVSRSPTDRASWFSLAHRIMDDYTERVPHSFVEEKEFGLAWHFRRSPVEFAAYQSRKLYEDLDSAFSNLPARVFGGKRVIEARAIEGDKGLFARYFLGLEAYREGAGVLALGDDVTDEDLFGALNEVGATIKIGREPSKARYRLVGQPLVHTFLTRALEIRKRAGY